MTTFRTIAELEGAGLVDAERAAALEPVAARYAVAVTPAIAALIDQGDPNDPIARQFIPDPAELARHPPSASTRSAMTPSARSKGSCIDIPTACC